MMESCVHSGPDDDLLDLHCAMQPPSWRLRRSRWWRPRPVDARAAPLQLTGTGARGELPVVSHTAVISFAGEQGPGLHAYGLPDADTHALRGLLKSSKSWKITSASALLGLFKLRARAAFHA